jgi:hypothetical protein
MKRKLAYVMSLLVTASAVWGPLAPLMAQNVGCSGPGCGGSGGVTAGGNNTLTGNNTFSGSNVASGRWTFGSAADSIDSIDFNETAGQITWEGAAADAAEHRLAAAVNAGFDTLTTIPATGGSQTVMLLENAQTVGGNKTFGGNTTVTGSLIINSDVNHSYGTGSATQSQYDTANTPDTLKFGTGTASNSITITESADISNDSNNGPCGTAACAHPNVIVRSATGATVADYSAQSYAGISGKSVKTLTEGAATNTVQITVAAEAGTSGMYIYTVYATDGATPQVRSGRIIFAVTNDGGTETCVLGTAEELDNTPTGTLTAAITCDTTPANAVNLQINATSSLTETTLEAYSQVYLSGPGQLLPQ